MPHHEGLPSGRGSVPFIPHLFGTVTQLLEPKKVLTPAWSRVTILTNPQGQRLLCTTLHSECLQIQTLLIFPTISARHSHYPHWVKEETEARRGLVACGRSSHSQSMVETRHEPSWLAFKTRTSILRAGLGRHLVPF